MAVTDKLQAWLTQTPKHLVAAVFSLAAAGIVVVVIVLAIVASHLAALPNKENDSLEVAPKNTPSETSSLVEIIGNNFRTNSTLNINIPTLFPDSKGVLNLEGIENLTFPVAITRIESDSKIGSAAHPKFKGSRSRGAVSTVRNINAGDPVDFSGLRNFQKDLKNTDFAVMAQKCWQVTPQVFTDRYTTAPAQAAIWQALETKPAVDAAGVKWVGKYVEVRASWEELSSTYSCPSLAYDGRLDDVAPEDVAYLIDRVMARSSYPLNGADTEDNYPTRCETWNPPKELTEYFPESAKQIKYDAKGLLTENDFDILQKLRNKPFKIYAVNQKYPMYLQASSTRIDPPAALLYRDTDGQLCLGSVVGE